MWNSCVEIPVFHFRKKWYNILDLFLESLYVIYEEYENVEHVKVTLWKIRIKYLSFQVKLANLSILPNLPNFLA